jgi:hypothetical protein
MGLPEGLPRVLPRGSLLADGGYQITVTGPMCRRAGRGCERTSTTVCSSFFVLDIKLEVKPTFRWMPQRAR